MSDNPSEDKGVVNPTGSDEPTPNNGSEQNKGNGQPDATRKLQSDRDQLRSENEKLKEQLDRIEGHIFNDKVEKDFGSFLKENADKYPDVDVEDMKTLAEDLTPEALDAAAKKAQGKYDRIRNKALADAYNVPDTTLSAEEANKELDNLQKEDVKPGAFGRFLDIRTRTRK